MRVDTHRVSARYRRTLRFSLRAVFAVVTITAVVSADYYNGIRRQRLFDSEAMSLEALLPGLHIGGTYRRVEATFGGRGVPTQNQIDRILSLGPLSDLVIAIESADELEAYRKILQVPTIEALEFFGRVPFDALLAIVPGERALNRLSLHNVSIGATGIGALRKFPSLSSLELEAFSEPGCQIALRDKFESLRSLHLISWVEHRIDSSANEPDLSVDLSGLSELREIVIHLRNDAVLPPGGSRCAIEVYQLPRLRSIALLAPEIEVQSLSMASLDQLTDLCLELSPPEGSFASLRKLPRLTKVHIHGPCRVSKNDRQAFADLRVVNELVLKNICMDDYWFQAIATIKSLRVLAIVGCMTGVKFDEHGDFVNDLNDLDDEEYDAMIGHQEYTGWDQLSRCRCLEQVEISSTVHDSRCLQWMNSVTSLKEVDLTKAAIGGPARRRPVAKDDLPLRVQSFADFSGHTIRRLPYEFWSK